MKDDLRYTPSDCFETFPFPPDWETDAALESIGREYYEFRARLMVESSLGLTKTYNRFHDPKEKAPEIARLRELHAAMDRAVLASYGWSDVDATCGFDLDWCDAEPADDASPDTVERLEPGRHWFPRASAALAFASELSDPSSRLPWRFRWRPEVRDDVLARLLLLNRSRSDSERLVGLSPLADDPDPDEADSDASDPDASDSEDDE